MEQISWKANGSAASEDILCILWNLKVQYCVHRRPPLLITLSQI
jgi:hypothetical protein